MSYINQTSQAYYDGNDFGNYQFVSLNDIVNQFMIVYVGEDKIIPKAKRIDVAFHAQRALAELSFDTFKSCKAKEFTVPDTLQMPLPQDYVNYTKISWVDSSGIKHLLYPTSKTSNPSQNYLQDSNGDFKLQAAGELVTTSSDVVLNGEYSNILVGMEILVGQAPYNNAYIPSGTVVGATSNSGGITTITLHDLSGNVVNPLISGTGITLTFQNIGGALITPKKSYNIVENLSWNTADYKITGTASELTNLKVGMFVYHEDFPIGTVIKNISGTTIIVSALPSVAVTSGGEITFVDSEDADSDTWSKYKSSTPSENQDDYQDDIYWPPPGQRYGLDPQHAQVNGSYYIDKENGKIQFSSNVSGKTVIIDYISDSLGTEDEMQVHKFAEEAMYKWISYGILSTRANTQEYIVRRYKKERFAETRKAKLRLSNIKLEEITQILRGKSKQIKH
jgi:hypothetical protein